MTYQELFNNIVLKNSFLCVGLDSDISKIPSHLLTAEDPIFEFNKQIVDATHQYTVAYKPNTAFYETNGAQGWQTLQKTAEYIRTNYPDIFLIADAKRGDIGNTSLMYAKAFLQNMPFDSVTVAPYMGEDSVMPFLQYNDKWVILLALTSNKGANDFQFMNNGESLFEKVLRVSQNWGNHQQMMYVVGATQARMLSNIRKIVPEHFLLVPGVGAQGGSLAEVAEFGMNAHCGLLVNSSRAIIYADNSENFAQAAAQNAKEVQEEMKFLLEKFLP